LLAAELDHLPRNAAFLLALRDSGVEFVHADVRADTRYDMTEANPMTDGIMAIVAEYEAEAVSARTTAALVTATRHALKSHAVKRHAIKIGNPRRRRRHRPGRAPGVALLPATLPGGRAAEPAGLRDASGLSPEGGAGYATRDLDAGSGVMRLMRKITRAPVAAASS
jgi:hypothetical protein